MIIKIKNLRAKTLIGVYEEERVAPREVILNIEIEFDHAKSVESDNLNDTIDYAVIEQKLVESLAKQSFALLEPLAQHVAELILNFQGAREVTVEIDKPGVLKYSDSVSVTHTVKK